MTKTTIALSLAASLCLPLCLASSAHAQSAPAIAEQLYRDGNELLKAGKTHEACTKFAESQRVDPQLGTLLNVASCHEKEGKVATAWSEFSAVVDQATKKGDSKRADYAKSHVADLEKKLPRLKMDVPAGTTDLKIDGQAIGDAAWTTALPIDAGDHQITYSAPGKDPRSQNVTVTPGTDPTKVVLAPLVASAVVPPPSIVQQPPPPQPLTEPPPPTKKKTSMVRVVGYGVAGAGIVGLGVGGLFGAFALGKNGDVNSNCGSSAGLPANQCNQTGFDAQKSTRTDGTISTIGFIAGGALLGAGVVMIILGKPTTVNETAYFLPSIGGFVAGGSF